MFQSKAHARWRQLSQGGDGDLRTIAARWLEGPEPDDGTAAVEAIKLRFAIDRALWAFDCWLESEMRLVEAVLGSRDAVDVPMAKGYPEYNPDQPRNELGRWARVGGVIAPRHVGPSGLRILLQGGRDWRRNIPPQRSRRDPARARPAPLEQPHRGDLPHKPETHHPGFLRLEEGGRLGGHTYSRHMNPTDKQLQTRARYEGQASRWKDEATAERITHQAMQAAAEEIAAWLASDSNKVLPIRYEGDKNVALGEGYDRNDPRKKIRTNATILLKKDGFGGYGIISTFPE